MWTEDSPQREDLFPPLGSQDLRALTQNPPESLIWGFRASGLVTLPASHVLSTTYATFSVH